MFKRKNKLMTSKDYGKITFFRLGSWVHYAGGNARQRATKERGIPLMQRIIEKFIRK